MELLTKLEQQVLKWAKGVPHLPTPARKWLGDNVWWIALVGAILTGIGILFELVRLVNVISIIGTPAESYFAAATFTTWTIVTVLIGLVFMVIEGLLLASSVTPLKEKQKKGWVLLFVLWLVSAVSVVVTAVLSLNPFGFVLVLLPGAIWLAITGYFLFEIHGQFAHVERSKGVKHAKKS